MLIYLKIGEKQRMDSSKYLNRPNTIKIYEILIYKIFEGGMKFEKVRKNK